MTVFIRATSIGVTARQRMATSGAARTIAAYRRAAVLETAEGIVCLVAGEIGRGPLNIVLEDWRQPDDRPIAWSLDGGGLTGGDFRVELTGAVIYAPPRWPARPPAARLIDVVAQAERLVTTEAPVGCLVRAALAAEDDPRPASFRDPQQPMSGPPITTEVLRHARPLLAALPDWIAGRADAPLGLLGLGPGSTPAGDDILGGLFLGLAAAGETARAGRLAEPVLAAAPRLTTPLSAALLAEAAGGRAGEKIVAAIAAIAGGSDPTRLAAVVDDATRNGHGSGWETLAGALVALRTLHRG